MSKKDRQRSGKKRKNQLPAGPDQPHRNSTPGKRNVRWNPLALGILISITFISSILLYLPTRNYDFAYDDYAVIKDNILLKKGYDAIGEIITSEIFDGYDPSIRSLTYRPVSMTKLVIQYELFGDSPSAYHYGNIILYALLSVMLLVVLIRMLPSYSIYLPFTITLLFVFHPIHAEVVANIKSHDEMTGFFFFLTSLYFLLKYYDERRTWTLGLSLVLYFLTLGSKESMLTTLAVIPLVLYFFRPAGIKQAAIFTIPFIIVFAIFFFIRGSVVGWTGSSTPITILSNPILAAGNFSEKAGTTLLNLGKYLVSALFPSTLIADYSYRSFPIVGISDLRAITSFLAYAAMIVIAILGFKRKSPYSFSILYFLATISIVSNVIVMTYAYSDRFMFTPSLGAAFMVGFALYQLAGKFDPKSILPRKSNRSVLSVALFILILGLSTYRILSYIPVWKDNMTLFRYCVDKVPENAMMRKNLGGEYARMAVYEKDTALQRKYAMMAIPELERAVAIYEKIATAHIHLGNCFILLHRYPEAKLSLEKALTYDTQNRFARSSLANVSYRMGNYEDAARNWLMINPDYLLKSDYQYISRSFQRLGDTAKASYYGKLARE